jgi:hypothetical protein
MSVIDRTITRPYDDAAVSNLFLFGRREDLAFEKPVGEKLMTRHYVAETATPALCGMAMYPVPHSERPRTEAWRHC